MTTPDQSSLLALHQAFRDELVDAGLVILGSIPGSFGRSGEFEAIIDGLNSAISRAAGDLAPEVLRFPPLFPREAFERTGYLESFPNLTGEISTFTGDDRNHAALLAAREDGADWSHFLTPTDSMLVPAACHSSYPILTGQLPESGRTLDVSGYCFRHEPAIDPARMQAFRIREFVHAGTPDQAVAHRSEFLSRSISLVQDLGLEVEAVPANDPFFGRAGRILARSQRGESLKTELVVRLYGDSHDGTAIASGNYHRDHFGSHFDIRTANGNVAHSACVGFGLERFALALLRTHGLQTSRWSQHVRAALHL
ncbi:MAG: amino acid--[acyl-carrier-protein] ligase [Nocardiaceae bacterium]|nr:amino acid--[acyl-carrier-protein] ligase [Nocardiaceae bacterium]